MPRKSTRVQLPSLPVRSAEDYRLLVESVSDYAIFLLDPTGRVATWNRGAEKIKGFRADEIIGAHFSKFYPPEDLVGGGKPARELAIAEQFGRVEDEGWRIRKDGSRFWASVVITALRDEGGNLRGFGKVTRDLTARRATEENLRQAEQRFHYLIDSVVDYAIFMLDVTGHVSTWNSGARRLKGYAADEIIGQHFSVFYSAEDRAHGKPERLLDLVRREGRAEDEGWRLRKDGTRFCANVIMTALRDDHGTLIGFAKVTRDLTLARDAQETDRRLLEEQTARANAELAERRLRESEERYRDLSQRLEIILEGVAEGITVQDRAGQLVFSNSAAAKIWGYTEAHDLMVTPRDEIRARFEVFDEHNQPISYDEMPSWRVLHGEANRAMMVHLKERGTRLERWCFVSASAVVGVDGKPELAISIWRDVTAERHEERRATYLAAATAAFGSSLQQSEMLSTLARSLVPDLADWCTIYLVHGGEIRRAATHHEDPARAAIAEEYERLSPPSASAALRKVVRTGHAETFNDIGDEILVALASEPAQLERLRALGMRSVLLAPIQASSRVLGVLTLVSARSERGYDETHVALAEELGRRAGAAIEKAELFESAQAAAKEAEQASRAKDEFLATVSHELRTPLNAILGWSTLLKERVSDPAIAKPVSVIHRNAQAQVKIIDDILDVSRVITGKFRLDPKPADLVSITREAIDVVRPSAVAKRITIAFASQADFCLLVADPERLQQVVWNLLSNAVKFTDTEGRISLSVRQDGSNVVLTVTDTGRGIEPGFLPFVFDRFKQADSSITRRVGGLGLGLALVRHIVELHGGRVVAQSDGLGKGAQFSMTLPIRAVIPPMPDAPSSAETIAAVPRVRIDLGQARVLVVDDEPDARELIATVLLQAGAVVETAASANLGFAAIERFRPNVIVSDIGMPDQDGLSFMRAVRALPADLGGRVPSLALTAFARDDDRARAIAAGYTAHIGKPVDPDALLSAVGELATLLHPR